MSVCICQSSVLRVDSSADAESLGGHFVRDGLQTLQLKQTSHFNYLNSSSFQLLFPKWQKGTVRNLWKKDSFPHHKTVGRDFN